MICHYCGRSAAPIKVCPQCGSLDVDTRVRHRRNRGGAPAAFPAHGVRRIDTDAVKKKKVLRDALTDFREGGSTCWSARRWWPRA